MNIYDEYIFIFIIKVENLMNYSVPFAHNLNDRGETTGVMFHNWSRGANWDETFINLRDACITTSMIPISACYCSKFHNV